MLGDQKYAGGSEVHWGIRSTLGDQKYARGSEVR